ncbi:hypothetical protein HA402_008808, partial [Bradysia odoriphaga]
DHLKNLFFDHSFRKNPEAQLDDVIVGECAWKDTIHKTNCDCRGYDISCRKRNLTKLPSHLPTDGIGRLNLAENQFSVIGKHFFDTLPEVELLILRHCSIRQILSDAFRVLSDIDLHTIYLGQNQLTSLPERFFPPGNRLERLMLEGNFIEDLLPSSFANLIHLIELDLRDNCISSFSAATFEQLIQLELLNLNNNCIVALTTNMIPQLSNLLTLNLEQNSIEYIENEALTLPSLENLYLQKNKLKYLINGTFSHLPNLKCLYLSDNEIQGIQLASFHGIENLTSLDLNKNPFLTARPIIFSHLAKLEHVYFRWFHLCGAVLHVRDCQPKGDGISSTHHLLDNIFLRQSVWFMAGVAIFGNVMVLLGRCLMRSKRHHNIEHDLFLKNLAASDLLMGVYLAIIAFTDINYRYYESVIQTMNVFESAYLRFRGVYVLYDEEWRNSFMCSMCGFLSTLSYQSSTLILSVVTWDRLISVTRPLQPRSSSRIRAILRLSILWLVAGCCAAAPFFDDNYFGEHFYGTNGVCLSIHIHDPLGQGWEYSVCLFICVNTMALLFIVFSYVRMLRAIRGSGEAMRSTVSGRENAVATRFAIIVMTNCCCWLPIVIVKLVALCGVAIHEHLYAWIAVFVLPVNSALNPVLYTLTTAAFKQQMNKICVNMPCGRDEESHNNNGYESAASFSMGHIPNGSGATKHLLTRRTTQTTLTFSCKRPTVV